MFYLLFELTAIEFNLIIYIYIISEPLVPPKRESTYLTLEKLEQYPEIINLHLTD